MKKTKRKRATKQQRVTPAKAPLPPITRQTVKRLEQLADDLDSASDEAAALAKTVTHDLALELIQHRLADDARRKRR
jgi:hypothetical protein